MFRGIDIPISRNKEDGSSVVLVSSFSDETLEKLEGADMKVGSKKGQIPSSKVSATKTDNHSDPVPVEELPAVVGVLRDDVAEIKKMLSEALAKPGEMKGEDAKTDEEKAKDGDGKGTDENAGAKKPEDVPGGTSKNSQKKESNVFDLARFKDNPELLAFATNMQAQTDEAKREARDAKFAASLIKKDADSKTRADDEKFADSYVEGISNKRVMKIKSEMKPLAKHILFTARRLTRDSNAETLMFSDKAGKKELPFDKAVEMFMDGLHDIADEVFSDHTDREDTDESAITTDTVTKLAQQRAKEKKIDIHAATVDVLRELAENDPDEYDRLSRELEG